MTNATETSINNTAPHIVDDFWLAMQDDCYAKHRLPAPTPEGAEDRTYCFRVECEPDLWPLKAMLNGVVEKWWQTPLSPLGDANVKVTLKPSTLTLDEIRWLFGKVGDCHAAVQTIALEKDYSGALTYREADEMGATSPRISALRQCIAGLNRWRDVIAAHDDRAIGAVIELANELDQQEALDELLEGPKH